jgi:hypothetical protein
MEIFKIILLVWFITFWPLVMVIVVTTVYLQDKLPMNKFRQWWCRNIIDLDNSYDEPDFFL